MYHVYQLLDYKGFCFYIGITKNIDLRLKEHEKNKNATPAKAYRVRKAIEVCGYLPYKADIRNTKQEALDLEKELIQRFKHQLVNVLHGKNTRSTKQIRSKGRSTQCPKCLNWYKRIGAHKCQK